jgi:hypothetical protein
MYSRHRNTIALQSVYYKRSVPQRALSRRLLSPRNSASTQLSCLLNNVRR